MVGIKMNSNINCYPMQNYTKFLIQALQLYLNFVKSQLHLIIYDIGIIRDESEVKRDMEKTEGVHVIIVKH